MLLHAGMLLEYLVNKYGKEIILNKIMLEVKNGKDPILQLYHNTNLLKFG